MREYGPVLLLMVAAIGTAKGQAMVGYGLGAARAVTTIAPARGVGKAIEKSWEKVERTTESKAKPAPMVKYEDPGKIETGLNYTDLVRRFGPPSMQITGDDGARTLTYVSKTAYADLRLKDGKVESVNVRRSSPEQQP